jgi:hypothetical protein
LEALRLEAEVQNVLGTIELQRLKFELEKRKL